MNMSIGTKIRELRVQHNLTQGDFAKKIGVAPSTVSHWEWNRASPQKEYLITITKEFDTPLDYFGIDVALNVNKPAVTPDLELNRFLLECYSISDDKTFLGAIKRNLGI